MRKYISILVLLLVVTTKTHSMDDLNDFFEQYHVQDPLDTADIEPFSLEEKKEKQLAQTTPYEDYLLHEELVENDLDIRNNAQIDDNTFNFFNQTDGPVYTKINGQIFEGRNDQDLISNVQRILGRRATNGIIITNNRNELMQAPRHPVVPPRMQFKLFPLALCPTCFDPLNRENSVFLPICGHNFCDECSKKLEDHCPLCRKKIEAKIKEKKLYTNKLFSPHGD